MNKKSDTVKKPADASILVLQTMEFRILYSMLPQIVKMAAINKRLDRDKNYLVSS